MDTKRTIISIVTCVVIWLSIHSEEPADYEYVPTVREGIEWTYNWNYNSPYKEGQYYLQFSGDSVINGKTYKVCYRYATVSLNKKDAIIEGFAREEDKKVYIIGRRTPDGNESNMIVGYGDFNTEERLVYDFTVGLGDNIQVFEGAREYPVGAIGYVRIGDKLRKAIYVGGLFGTTLWAIEGIGFASERDYDADLITPDLAIYGCFPCFTCQLAYVQKCWNKGIEFDYTDFDFDTIDYIENHTELMFVLDSGKLTITAPDSDVRRTQIVDTGGKVVWNSMHNGVSTVEIPTADFQKGVYIAIAETAKGRRLSQKVVLK